jgi:hypothetical protein
MALKKILAFIAVLLFVFVVCMFVYTYLEMTAEVQVLHPDPVIAIVVDLRNLRAAAEIFLNENLDKQGTIKPDLRLLARHTGNPIKFTKTPNEYLFGEANGKWWVGYNLEATDLYSNNRNTVCERLKFMSGRTIYGSMDIKVPYDEEDIVFMLVR